MIKSLFFKNLKKYAFIYLSAGVYMRVCHKFLELVISFDLVGPRNLTQTIRIGGK